MRRISFALTTDAVNDRRKDVTRRLGWWYAKPGMRLLAVDKLRTKSARRLAVIEVVSVRAERLWRIYADHWNDHDGGLTFVGQPTGYDFSETAREGFPGLSGVDFAAMLVKAVQLPDDDIDVNRIEFRYLDCYVCGARPTCVGAADGSKDLQPMCDAHCGHGQEDGQCWPLEAGGEA